SRGARFVPLDLIEVAEGASGRPHLRAELGQLLSRDLAQRTLDPEIGQVEILLVDDRGDPCVDLDHEVTDELDVEEVLDAELRDDSLRDLKQPVIVQRLEVHREPGTHRLARLGVPEHELTGTRNAIDRSLASLRELHHEEVWAPFLGQHLEDILETHRKVPGTFLDQLLGAVDRGVEDAKSARARARDRLEAARARRVAELCRSGGERTPADDLPPGWRLQA